MHIKFFQDLIDTIRKKDKRPTPYELAQLKYDIGIHSYIGENCTIKDNVKIGKYCSIAWNVSIRPTQHPLNLLSTHPFQYHSEPQTFGEVNTPEENKVRFTTKGCVIENDVFIGCNAVIMDGVKICNGAVIGANSVITKNIPPYAIVVGNNKIIKYRFDENIIKELLELKWWDLPEEKIVTLPFDNIEECIKQLKKIKRRL